MERARKSALLKATNRAMFGAEGQAKYQFECDSEDEADTNDVRDVNRPVGVFRIDCLLCMPSTPSKSDMDALIAVNRARLDRIR